MNSFYKWIGIPDYDAWSIGRHKQEIEFLENKISNPSCYTGFLNGEDVDYDRRMLEMHKEKVLLMELRKNTDTDK